MAGTLREMMAHWFADQDNHQKYVKTSITKSEREKAYKKCLKDTRSTKDVLKLAYFNFMLNEAIKGNLKPKSHVNISATPEAEVSEIELVEWSPGQDAISPGEFDTWKTGKGVDVIFSVQHGATKATSYILHGPPGVGKTTVAAAMQRDFQKNHPDAKMCCVQSEMKRFDIKYEYHINQLKWMADLKYLILKDYGFSNIKNTLIKIFTSGYEMIFLDSVEDVVSKLKVYADMSEREAENFLLELMDNANEGKNNNGVKSTIIAIQQVNKDGSFKGDNKLKHMTTGMIELGFDGKKRYVKFSKNRRCGKHTHKKLYFYFDEHNEVQYDLVTFEKVDQEALKLSEEAGQLKEMSEKFMSTFKVGAQQVQENEDKKVSVINNKGKLLINGKFDAEIAAELEERTRALMTESDEDEIEDEFEEELSAKDYDKDFEEDDFDEEEED